MFRQISIEDAVRVMQMTGGILIDLRSPQEYQEGHLLGACNIPVEEIEQGLFYYGGNSILILYCMYGAKSMMASRILDQQGYQIINTIGGFSQYQGDLDYETHLFKIN